MTDRLNREEREEMRQLGWRFPNRSRARRPSPIPTTDIMPVEDTVEDVLVDVDP